MWTTKQMLLRTLILKPETLARWGLVAVNVGQRPQRDKVL